MKKLYQKPVALLAEVPRDVIRTSGLFDAQTPAEQQTLDDYLSGFGVKAGIGKYSK